MEKTALITGASSGIGMEMAKIFAQNGITLVLVARRENILEKLKLELEEQYKIKVFNIIRDLSEVDSANDIYDIVKLENINIDFLINNAGFGNYGKFVETDWLREHHMINLNITTLTYLTKLFLKDIVQNNSGRIMNVASTAAFQPGPLMAVYYATKAYVMYLSEAIADELKGTNVSITTLCPGPTISEFKETAALGTSGLFNRRSLPESREVARFGYNAMMKGKRVVVHGFTNKLLAFFTKILPRKLVISSIHQLSKQK
jgi:short-subunit dehydrogenase